MTGVLIHRPIIRGPYLISFSPDLKHWGGHRILIPSAGLVLHGWAGPAAHRNGPGLADYLSRGQVTVSGSLYRVGLALLDLASLADYQAQRRVFGPRYASVSMCRG